MEKKTPTEKLLSKLRTPLHIDYICENILKMEKTECLNLLTDLVNKGIIDENKRYYKIKSVK
jgi:hypothetical protein